MYVVNCLKSHTRAGGNKKLHCPSYQFIETMRLMAHATTNHLIKWHRDPERVNGTASLSSINNNPIEQLHSEERVGGIIYKEIRWEQHLCEGINGSHDSVAASV